MANTNNSVKRNYNFLSVISENELNRGKVQVHFVYREPQVPPTLNFRNPARRFVRRPCLARRKRVEFNLFLSKSKEQEGQPVPARDVTVMIAP